MAVRTAKGGKADWSAVSAAGPWTNIPEVRSWRLRPATEAKRYASSSTAGATRRLEGVDDFTIDISLYVDGDDRFDADTLAISSGDTGWLRLYEDATAFYVAPVYISEYEINVEIEEGNPISGSISAEGNGTLVKPA